MNMTEEIRRLRREAADHQSWREAMSNHLAWLRQQLEAQREENCQLKLKVQQMRKLLDDYAKQETARLALVKK